MKTPQTAHSSIGIISDFDDTIKITNTTNRIKTVLRGLFKNQHYAGMSELYQEVLSRTGGLFFVVSSSPKSIRYKILRFLDQGNYPKRVVYLRDWLRQKDVRAYKMKAIISILESYSSMQWILVGDDSEWDPEIYAEIKAANPTKIVSIYIRSIRNRPLPPMAQSFFTPYEVALHEYNAGRLILSQVARIGKSLTDADDFEKIIPYFAHHPTDSLAETKNDSLAGLQESIERRLRTKR